VLASVLIGMTLGIVIEVCARLLKLWVYRQPQTPALNVIVVAGLIMGTIATFVPRYGMLPVFIVGFAVGLFYETANLSVLKWWDFPDQRMGFIRGHAAIVVVASVGWGLIPLITARVHAVLPRTVPFEMPHQSQGEKAQSQLEKLNEREKALIEKLDAVRQRQGDLEARLEDVRHRKQLLLEKQAVRSVERPAARRSPTP